jgi:hypothetical protein
VPIIPGNDVSSLEVTVPGGRVVTMNVPEGDGLAGMLAFSETNEAGVYRVVEKRSSGEDAASGVFVVNAGHRQESNLAPNPDLASLLEGGAQADAGGASQEGVLQELWPLIVGAVVAVIGAEWFLRLRQDRRRVAATVTTRRATP